MMLGEPAHEFGSSDEQRELHVNTKRYQFRLSGLQEAEGHIKAATLQRVLEALGKTAERAARLLATGEGSGKGRKPGWLDAAVDFTVTGLEPGSTILDIEAPRLSMAASEEFIREPSWSEPPGPDDTALDLAALAIREIGADEPSGDRFDGAVLEAILMFKRASGANTSFELVSTGSVGVQFAVDDRMYKRAQERLKNIPVPRAFVVTGWLDEIGYVDGWFRLLVNNTTHLHGRLDLASLTVDTLASLRGKAITVEGIVHFKADGQPRFIEARRVGTRLDGDEIFEELPVAEIVGPHEVATIQHRKKHVAKPMDLVGTWPGDEPLEELLAQLD